MKEIILFGYGTTWLAFRAVDPVDPVVDPADPAVDSDGFFSCVERFGTKPGRRATSSYVSDLAPNCASESATVGSRFLYSMCGRDLNEIRR